LNDSPARRTLGKIFHHVIITKEYEMNKLEIATEIGKLEGELSTVESELREHERQINSAKNNRTSGAAALLIGILGFLFLYFLWYLWLFLGIIGILTLFTAMGKQKEIKERIQASEKQISYFRAELAERRAKLSIL
jgi:ABC-type Fe3+-citrate transport system substrate-binding protein